MLSQTPSSLPATALSPGSKINDYHAVPGSYYHFPRTKVTVHRNQLESYLALLQDWDSCQRCPISPITNLNPNRRFIHVSGYLPCDLLFIGEAPGQSEDALGQPFVGPAGRLLHNRILHQPHVHDYYKLKTQKAICHPVQELLFAFTNVVSCRPFSDYTPVTGSKNREPNLLEIDNCHDRLARVLDLAKPRGIILVGGIAQNALESKLRRQFARFIHMVHPAWILRQSPKTQETIIADCQRQLHRFLDSLE